MKSVNTDIIFLQKNWLLLVYNMFCSQCGTSLVLVPWLKVLKKINDQFLSLVKLVNRACSFTKRRSYQQYFFFRVAIFQKAFYCFYTFYCCHCLYSDFLQLVSTNILFIKLEGVGISSVLNLFQAHQGWYRQMLWIIWQTVNDTDVFSIISNSS